MSTNASNKAVNHLGTAVASSDPLPVANAFLERYARYRATRPELLGPVNRAPLDTFLPPGSMPLIELLPTLLPNSESTAATIGGMVCVPLQDLNILYQVRDNAKCCGVSHDEELLTELAALIFDRIFQDRLVPELIKRMLAQLQIPVLKAMLLDRSLIAQPGHSVRQLLDIIAETASGRSDVDDIDSDYCQLIKGVVNDIELHSDTGLALFTDAIRQIDELNRQTWTRESKRHETAIALLQDKERREIIEVQLSMHLRDAISGLELHEQVREFLLSPWYQVLLQNYLNHDRASTVPTLKNTITDLVWSVQPKISLQERQRLAQMLPLLLNTLRQGLTSINWPRNQQDAFLALLMDLHTSGMHADARTEWQDQAFKLFEARISSLPNNLEPDPDRPGFSAESVDISPRELEILLREERILVLVAHPPLDAHPPAVLGLSRVEAGDTVAQLQPSTWIEFLQDGQTRLLKLRWVSPMRTLLLFTDGAGEYSILFTPEVLRAHLENHTASILGQQGLTGRVLASIEASMASP